MPLTTPKSFVYQETDNNFTDNRQQINGHQIVSVKTFATPTPTTIADRPDYVGQLGIGSKADGSPTVYVSGNGPNSTFGWDLVSTGVLTDEYANKDKANNFSNTYQTILNKQIPYIEQGFTAAENVPIKGQGHMYVDMTDPTAAVVSMAVIRSGGGFEWVRMTDHTELDNVVMKNAQNNFKDGRQTILNQSIASINPSINRPISPVRSGEMYLQKGDQSKGDKPKLWISAATSAGAFEWIPISHSLDEDLVFRNVSNNFTNVNQKLLGKQIMSFATRGDQPPQGYKPDYDGQFYIAMKTLSSGQKDVAVWIANGDTWVPMSSNIDPAKIVVTDKENVFTKVNQRIKVKNKDEFSQITGARMKINGQAPNADASYKATMIGEVCIYKNDTTTPSQISVWVAISMNPNPLSNAGEWTMIYSSTFDQTKLAKTDAVNIFERHQQIIGPANKAYEVMGAYSVYDEASPLNRIVPTSVGQTYIIRKEEPGPNPSINEVYLATNQNDSTSWLKIYDKPLDKVVRSDEKTFFTKQLFLGAATSTKKLRVNGVREKTDGTVYNTTLPLQLGETVMCTETINGEEWIVIYMCAMDQETTPPGQKSRKNWIEIGRRKKSELVHS